MLQEDLPTRLALLLSISLPRVQEISGDDRREAGRIPRTIECELTADLVDSCVPGDMVTIVAIVKATGSEEGRGRHMTCLLADVFQSLERMRAQLDLCLV